MQNKMAGRKDIWSAITLGILLLYALVLVLPLFTLLKESIFKDGALSFEHFGEFFGKKYYYSTLFNSLKVTVAVTLASLVIATPLAYIMTTFKIKGKLYLQILILISSMAPPFIGAYAWILLMGRNGVVTNFLSDVFHITMPDIYGFSGILIVLTLQLIPLIYMFMMGAFKSIDNSLIEAAESMGYTGFKKVWKVIMPLMVPTILAGSLLVFMRALADFGTPMLIGEGFETLPVLIFNEFTSEMGGNAGFAAAISVIVVVIALTIFLLQKYITNKKSFSMSALHPIKEKKESGIKNVVAHLFVYGYLALAILPQLYVVYTAFLKTSGRIFVKGYSLDSFKAAFTRSGDTIVHTFTLGLIALFFVILIAILIAYVTVRRRNAITNGLDIISMVPYIVPGSVLGVALLLGFNNKPFLLSGTATIIIIAFVIRRLPYTIRSSAAIIHQISPSIEEAAASLGASNLKTFFKITLPMMLPGVISGAILSWVTIISELSTSILLYTVNTKTMTIGIYTEVIRGNYGVAAALSTILIAITVISLLIFFKLTGRKEVSL
ncbi:MULTISPECIES: ABC transporter permease [Oceanobacillus]|uniref:Iron ABC transporter permease n=1 Tax=Oceanobacillus neutriphilus TaxID=531815 RepID=A0ABQ2NQM3_9BACI|nr:MULTISPECIES: iron ABC transporter permease [Oceanobacillus]MCT1902013.1 iron ABC transporter permease [Oceanobacillus sojae]GGP07634.1 iron ABC transporter permease [Oceanobacillus neutriphilus]